MPQLRATPHWEIPLQNTPGLVALLNAWTGRGPGSRLPAPGDFRGGAAGRLQARVAPGRSSRSGLMTLDPVLFSFTDSNVRAAPPMCGLVARPEFLRSRALVWARRQCREAGGDLVLKL